MSISELTSYEQTIVDSWSDIHKKSSLMFLVLLAVEEEARRSGEIRAFIDEVSSGRLAVDDQSLHRALRRIEGLNLLIHTEEPVAGSGVKRKVYALTEIGARVLDAYAETTLSYLRHPRIQAFVNSPSASLD